MLSEVRVPRVSENENEGLLVAWHRDEGDEVEVGDPLFEIETDKATVIVEAEAEGTLRQVLVPVESTIEVGQVIAYIGDPDEPLPEAAPEPARGVPAPASVAAPCGAPVPAASQARLSPAARRRAGELGIALDQLEQRFPDQTISAKMVEQVAAEAEEPSRLVPAEMIDLPHQQLLIGERLARSQTTRPNGYLQREVDVTALLARLQAETQQARVRLSLVDAFIWACARALDGFPLCNACWQSGRAAVYREINVGIALDSDGILVAPAVRSANGLDVAAISRAKAELQLKLMRKRLAPTDWETATFTITDMGPFDVDAHVPIIPENQGCILGLGRVQERPTVQQGDVAIGRFVNACLTFDHRLMNGAYAARFVQAVVKQLDQCLA